MCITKQAVLDLDEPSQVLDVVLAVGLGLNCVALAADKSYNKYSVRI